VTGHEDLLARRDDYPVLATRTYLASHTLGAMHRRTPERLAKCAALGAAEAPRVLRPPRPRRRSR
jgi:hypothetical protein